MTSNLLQRHVLWSYRPYQNLGQIAHNLHDYVLDDVICKPPIEVIPSDSEPADLNAAFKDISLLNVQQMTDFNMTATMVFDSIHGNCPEHLADMSVPAQQIHNHETRHDVNGSFPPHINCVAGQQSFLNRGYHLWNSLPHSLKEAPTPQCFKTNLFKVIAGSGSL